MSAPRASHTIPPHRKERRRIRRAKGRSSGMSEANKALVRREIEEVFNEGNLDACEEIYAPDYVGHEPTAPEGIKGVEGARRFAATYPRGLPGLPRHHRGHILRGGPRRDALHGSRHPRGRPRRHPSHGEPDRGFGHRYKPRGGRKGRRGLDELRRPRPHAANRGRPRGRVRIDSAHGSGARRHRGLPSFT